MKDLVKVASQNLVGIFLDIDIPEPARKVDLAEFGINVAELSANALVEIEGAKLIDPKDLTKFRTIKQRMWRAYSQPGLKFMGGRAMSRPTALQLCKVLDECIAEANLEKKSFTDSFFTRAKAWAEQHPQHKEALTKALSNVGNIGERIKFNYLPFPIGILDDQDSPLNAKIETQIEGLADELFRKNSARATEIWEQSFMSEAPAGKGEVKSARMSVRASCLKPICELRDNFVDLAFIDDRAEPVVSYINHVLGALPPEGPFEGRDLSSLQMLLMMLRNADMTKQVGEMLRGGKSCNEADAWVAPFLGFQPKKAEVAAQSVGILPASRQPGLLFDLPAVDVAPDVRAGFSMPGMDAVVPGSSGSAGFSIPLIF
ncbi:DUF3150 domain-containing protein [Duganella vulcania]|uniref:DUF3150 domain-containing protein n=1 Tax=Duganella vulcania TaxID=2692166 RepID=A0A845GDN5_9BURK|nr:DUF3150 domain-containing protein [Duganella vulcania]MYM92733.1 DUF3150 domain-containing protein [Duganella vulcania]